MSIWDLLLVLVRRWYLVVGALLIALVASYLVKERPGVYWSRAEVTFLAPASTINPNTLTTRSTDLIVTAGVVAKRINGNLQWNKTSDPAATIMGQGITDGWTVRLPDYGGQWDSVFSRQVLEVQVAGPTEEVVQARQQELFARIDAELAALQVDVPQRDRITTTVVPDAPTVYYFAGSKMRAVAMIWLLCGAAAIAVAVEMERRAGKRRAGAVPARRGRRRPDGPDLGLDPDDPGRDPDPAAVRVRRPAGPRALPAGR